jgi:uncharacterized protein (DUF305 family)
MRMPRTAALASIVVAGALALAGCTTTTGMNGMDDDSAPATSAASFNAADEMFLLGMIPHHEQALEMAEIVLAKDGVDERVVGLAQRIQAAQQPEIDLMTSWLEGWGLDSDLGGMPGMDHGTDGMMSEQDMTALAAATGPEASKLFLEQMIQHHQGAIVMAQQEIANGQNADVLDLAQQIIDAQTAEIDEMEQLLAQL